MEQTLIRDAAHPQHYTNKALFSQYTWWSTIDAQPRIFVIVQRWHNFETQDIESLDLLEQGTDAPATRPYEEFYNLFKAGRLRRICKPA